MKAGFYSRLALDGIRKNRKLYIPYLMTCVLMVSVYYILAFLSKSDLVANMKGGGSARSHDPQCNGVHISHHL
jgi:putative ABC transport system permease protein